MKGITLGLPMSLQTAASRWPMLRSLPSRLRRLQSQIRCSHATAARRDRRQRHLRQLSLQYQAVCGALLCETLLFSLRPPGPPGPPGPGLRPELGARAGAMPTFPSPQAPRALQGTACRVSAAPRRATTVGFSPRLEAQQLSSSTPLHSAFTSAFCSEGLGQRDGQFDEEAEAGCSQS